MDDDINIKKENPGCANSTGRRPDSQPDHNIENNTPSGGVFQAETGENKTVFNRPGVSDKTLIEVKVRRVTAEEAQGLCGFAAAGIWIPYFDTAGNHIISSNRPYGRLRLDEPRGDLKYYQEKDSGCHAYIPYPFVGRYKPGEPLYLTEGEFKSLALIEDDYQSAALPGFYGYAHGELLPELKSLLDKIKPSKIYFIGDSDTCLNYRFSVAAYKLATLVAPIPVLLPRLPLNGPKGIDDLKEACHE